MINNFLLNCNIFIQTNQSLEKSADIISQNEIVGDTRSLIVVSTQYGHQHIGKSTNIVSENSWIYGESNCQVTMKGIWNDARSCPSTCSNKIFESRTLRKTCVKIWKTKHHFRENSRPFKTMSHKSCNNSKHVNGWNYSDGLGKYVSRTRQSTDHKVYIKRPWTGHIVIDNLLYAIFEFF